MPTTGFDHAVLLFASMDEAEALPRRLGFTTTPRAVHPFGTGNVLVQFDDHNLEYLAVVDPARVDAEPEDRWSFARFNRDFLARNGPGFSMVVFKSRDREREAERFRDAGFLAHPFGFARAAKAPDGTDAEVSFELLFAEAPLLSDAGLFACRHLHAPELFYKPQYQSHPNTATGVSAVLMAALEPAAVAETLAIATGGAHRGGRFGEAVAFGPDSFEILGPDMIREAYGVPVHVPASGLRHVGFRIAVADPSALRACLSRNDVAFEESGAVTVVGPAAGGGTVYVFEPAG